MMLHTMSARKYDVYLKCALTVSQTLGIFFTKFLAYFSPNEKCSTMLIRIIYGKKLVFCRSNAF